MVILVCDIFEFWVFRVLFFFSPRKQTDRAEKIQSDPNRSVFCRGPWKFDRWLHLPFARPLPNFHGPRQKTDRLAPVRKSSLSCVFFRQKLVDNTKVNIFENRLDQSAQKFAGGRAICSWRHVQIFMVATKKLIDRHQLECGCWIWPARAKISKSGCNRSFF